MRADNRLSKSLEEAFINNDTQYNFGGWAPQKLFPTNLWVAGGLASSIFPSYYNSLFAYSRDGINWFSCPPESEVLSYVANIVWSGDKWVAVGQRTNFIPEDKRTTICYSLDGINWEVSNENLTMFSGICQSITFNGEMYVASGGRPAKLAYSYDGINWSASTNGSSILTGSTGGYVAWNGTNFGMVSLQPGSNWIFSTSNDGISWSSNLYNSGFTGQISNLIWANNKWFVSGNGFINYSTDGVNWSGSSQPVIFVNFWLDVEYNGNMFVAGGASYGSYDNLIYSYDGLVWSASTNGNTFVDNYCDGIAWNGSMWIATGFDSSFTYGGCYSYDGITWYGIDLNTPLGAEGTAIASRPSPNSIPPIY
jgi:hypothetical protein